MKPKKDSEDSSLDPLLSKTSLVEIEILTECNESFLKQVEQDLIEIIMFQSLRNRLRMKSGRLKFLLNPSKHWLSLRKILLTLCMVATFFLLYQVIFQPDNRLFLIMLPIYIVLTFGLWCVRNPNSQTFSNYIDKKSAKKILRIANQILPFDAHYHFSSNLVTYHRLKDEDKTLVFSKELERFAIVHEHATLFYKDSTAIVFRTLIMYDEPQQMIRVLTKLNIEFIVFTPELYSELQAKIN